VVETVYADPERPDLDPFVADRIECRRCGRANDFTLTLEARWVMLAELVRSLALGPDGKPVPSAIKAASIGLEDGRRMSVDEARRDYETRLAGHPDDPGLHVGYANVLRSGKRDAEAAASYRRALALDPDAVEAHASVATLAAEHGDFHEAARGMERCLRSLPRGHFYRLSKNDRAGFIEAVQENLRDFRRLAEVPVAIRVPAQIAAPAAEASHRPPVGRPPVGRNAPCPCGSGKKFKKCCG
jgi:tetratricopeptide (TPR) repeat protein